jgi:hypothetical protein
MDKAQARLLYGDLAPNNTAGSQWSSGLRSNGRTPAGKRPLRL